MRKTVLLLALLAGCREADRPTGPEGSQEVTRGSQEVTPGTTAKPKLTRAEFKKKWVGKSTDDLIAEYGRPTDTMDFGDGQTSMWTYKKILTDPVTGKLDDLTQVTVRHGKVAGLEP